MLLAELLLPSWLSVVVGDDDGYWVCGKKSMLSGRYDFSCNALSELQAAVKHDSLVNMRQIESCSSKLFQTMQQLSPTIAVSVSMVSSINTFSADDEDYDDDDYDNNN